MSSPEGSLAVIGAGTMGRGIARAAAGAGIAVSLYDLDRAAAERVADGLAGLAGAARAVGELAAAVRGADVVLECVPELLAVKAGTLRAIHEHADPAALLATNTSTMSIAELAKLAGSDRLLGLHFFNPAEKMRLIEVVHTPGTPPGVLARGEDFARQLGKTPVAVRDSPGFVTSRLGLVLGNEAMLVLQDGVAGASAIDAAMRLGYNHPMGPLELADLVGLDARLNNLRTLHAARGEDRFAPPRILIDLVEANQLGLKTGVGFYRYDQQRTRLGEAPLPGRRSA